MNFNDIEEYFPVGSKIRVIAHGESVEGTLIKLNATSIVLRRADNGRPKIIDCAKIESMEDAKDAEYSVEATTLPEVPVVQVTREILATPLIYLAQPAPVEFVHKNYIKSRLKEYRKSGEFQGIDADWNKLNNAFEDAKKNNSLTAKRDTIFRQLKELLNNYPSEPANIFAGDVYSAYDEWARASLAYAKAALYPEATVCAMNVVDTKNFLVEVLRRQNMDNTTRSVESLRMFFYYAAESRCRRIAAELVEKISAELTNAEREIVCQGCYKILVDGGNANLFTAEDFDYSSYGLRQLVEILKQAGHNDPPLNLKTATNSEIVETSVYRGKITLFKQPLLCGFIDKTIYFNLAQVEDKDLRAALNQFGLWRDNIRVTYILGEGKNGPAADHIKLMEGEQLPPNTADVHSGVIDFYNSNLDFGKVIDLQNGCSYSFKLDTVLDPCLCRYLQDFYSIRRLNVQFTIKLFKNKQVVRRLRLTMEELSELNREYGLAEPTEQPELFADVPKNLLQYQPLPSLRQDKVVVMSAKAPKVKLPIQKPFAPPIAYPTHKSNSYEEGCRHLAKKNYAKAATCFEQSIQDESLFEKSLGNLITIYMVDYGEDLNEQIEKGLSLLSHYEQRLDKSSITGYRIQLLDKAKRHNELIEELRLGIAVSYKVNQRMHYRLQLAREYRLSKNYEAALECYESWIKEKNRNRNKLSLRIDLIARIVNRNIAVCLYFIGEKNRAKEIARELLKDIPEDPTALNILEDRLQGAAVDSTAEAEDFDSDRFTDYGSSLLSPYAEYVFDQITLEKTYATAYHRIFKGKFDSAFKGDDFLGTPEDAAKIKEGVRTSLKNSSDKERSEAWAFVSKLIMKVRSKYSDDQDRCEQNKINSYRVHESVAQFLGYAGDYELQQQLDCNVDVARFFYNEEISMVPKGSDIDTRAYFIKLIASFFIEPNAVPQLKPSREDENAHLYYLRTGRDSCEPRMLLINTFLIPDKMQKRISEFLEELVKYPKWLDESAKLFAQLLPEQECTLTEGNFKSWWQRAKEVYIRNIEKFLKILRDAAENYDDTSETGLDSFLDKINTVLESSLLSKTDEERIKDYCAILSTMCKIGDKSTFGEKEEDYKKVIEKSDNLMKVICKKPTKLSYETLHEVVDYIHFKAEEELKKLYESSVPTLKIETDIIGADPVQFIVTVENKENCQTAGNMKVEVTSIDGGVEFKALSKMTGVVQGGDRGEFLYEAILGDKEKSQGYFEATVRVAYRYRVAVDETTENSIERNENISLLNSEDYEEIVNVYHSISETNGVPIESNLFYGRDEDIKKIVRMLKLPDGSLLKHKCLVMHGQKRAGKTSIMNHLKQKIREVYGPEAYVIVSVGSVGEINPPSLYAFLSTIIYKLEETLHDEYRELYNFLRDNGVDFPYVEIETSPSDDAKQGFFKRTLSQVIAKSRSFGGSDSKFIPLFLIDEFTYFYRWIKDGIISDNFMKFWKAFLQNNPICAIIIGMDHMPQFIDEYENEFACSGSLAVHFLNDTDTKDLANKPILLKDGSSRYRDKPGEDALLYIYRLTAGSAYLTVIFCKAFVEYLNKRKTTYITRTVIDNFIRERLLGSRPVLEKKMFEPQLNDPGKFSREEREATYSDNKAVLTYIAVHADKLRHELSREKIDCVDELSEKSKERLDIIIDQLTRRRVLTIRGGKYYKIEVELLRMWLRHEIGEDF